MYKYAVVFVLCVLSSLVGMSIMALFAVHPITVYLPNVVQGSEPMCLVNRGTVDVSVYNGPTLHGDQMVNIAVVHDFEWGFDTPSEATKRTDVDCLVIQK